MTDQLTHDLDEPAPSRRRSGRGLAFVGALCFLLGIAFTVFLGSQGNDPLLTGSMWGDEETASEPEAADPEALSETQPSAEVAQQALQIVARQQGGLDQRVAALEQRIARLDLQAQAVEGNTARAEGLLIAFAARRAIERGAPLGYLEEQLKLRFGESRPRAVGAVIDAAEQPVTVDRLIGRLSALAPKLEVSRESDLITRARNELGSLFVIRRESAPSPQPRRRLDRAKLFLESGRVDAAVAEVRNMPGAIEASEWLADAERYARAQEALDRLETAAVLDSDGLRNAEGQKVVQPSPAAQN